MEGLHLFGVDDTVAKAVALQQAQQPKAPVADGGGMSWGTIGGIVLTVVASALALPWIIKHVG